jgi:hypothetical protein
VTRTVVDAAWDDFADPDDDFAFLVVSGPVGGSLEGQVSAEKVSLGRPDGRPISVEGYPDGRSVPISCRNKVGTQSPTQLVFDCGGFTAGTSGSPFLTNVDRVSGVGTVVGVIGGYEQGGDGPGVSYAARFNAAFAALYRTVADEPVTSG